MLLSDGSVLLVGNEHVARIAPDGHLTPLCDLPADVKGSAAALINGDLVVAYFHDVRAYTLPDAPTLAATGWVMHGGSPAQDWAVRRAPADGRAPAAVPAAPFVPFPAGVADPTADVAYVQGDSGFAVALALGDGTERWRTPAPARPVGIWHDHVVVVTAGAGALHLAQLDPTGGATLTTSQPIPLADLDSVTLAPWGEPLSIHVDIEGDRARLSWMVAINGRWGGPAIRPYGASGLADVDLTTGVVALSPTRRWEGTGTPIGGLWAAPLAMIGGRTFTLLYAATATLRATDTKSGETLWTRHLWSIALPPPGRIAPPD